VADCLGYPYCVFCDLSVLCCVVRGTIAISAPKEGSNPHGYRVEFAAKTGDCLFLQHFAARIILNKTTFYVLLYTIRRYFCT